MDRWWRSKERTVHEDTPASTCTSDVLMNMTWRLFLPCRPILPMYDRNPRRAKPENETVRAMGAEGRCDAFHTTRYHWKEVDPLFTRPTHVSQLRGNQDNVSNHAFTPKFSCLDRCNAWKAPRIHRSHAEAPDQTASCDPPTCDGWLDPTRFLR